MARETQAEREQRATQVLKLLKRYYPDAHCALNHATPFQLVIATVLSAQCTDERVNIVTAELFKRFPDAPSMAEASLKELEEIVKSTGFFRAKAKNIQETARRIVREFKGEVPQNMEDLVCLPGVGRKTANVVLGNAFHIASGIVVDTHVGRLSRRLDFTRQEGPEQVEKELQELVPKKDWIMYSHWLIFHGRRVCKARKPDCAHCFLDYLCPKRI